MKKYYTHKETWSRRGENFLIEVVRWETLTKEKYEEIKNKIPFYDTGRFVWNVYCYIYPKHKLFNELTEEDISGGRTINNFHGGCTYAYWSRKKDEAITCKQYGCDYNHLHDEHYTFIENPEKAWQVFSDAEDLFQELSHE